MQRARPSTEYTPRAGMTNWLLDDPDALTLILQQLRVENDLTTSLRRLGNFSAVNRYALEYLSAPNAELARDLLGVDIGMSPSGLATMISRMTPTHRARLVALVQWWNTPHVIEDRSFMNCTALAIKTLSSELTAIGRHAFSTCTALNVVQWHAPRLAIVGVFAFDGCASLTLETWTTPMLTSIGCGAFCDSPTLVLSKWNAPKLTIIHENVFASCSGLTLADWHAPNLYSIGPGAFSDCTSLELLTGLPGNLDTMRICYAAFSGCTNLSALARSQIAAINANALDPV